MARQIGFRKAQRRHPCFPQILKAVLCKAPQRSDCAFFLLPAAAGEGTHRAESDILHRIGGSLRIERRDLICETAELIVFLFEQQNGLFGGHGLRERNCVRIECGDLRKLPAEHRKDTLHHCIAGAALCGFGEQRFPERVIVGQGTEREQQRFQCAVIVSAECIIEQLLLCGGIGILCGAAAAFLQQLGCAFRIQLLGFRFVHDAEIRGDIELRELLPQQPDAVAVDRRDIRALEHGHLPAQPVILRLLRDAFCQRTVQAGTHLACGIVRECDDDHFLRGKFRLREHDGQALDQHGCFAAAGSRADNDRCAAGVNRRFLLRCPAHFPAPPLRCCS